MRNTATKRKKRYLTGGLIFLILLSIIYYFQTLPAANCLLISTTGFQRVDQNIFCSPGSGQSLRDSLRVIVEQAKFRNEEFWGKPTQFDFTVIFCSSKKEMKKYAGNENYHTISLITPIGTYIVIDSTGLNSDILSHEINHSVLAKTIGYRAYSRLPVWFTEGIALQLDNRELMIDSILQKKYTTNAILLDSISKHEAFHNKDWAITHYNYLISRYEVENWIYNNGIDGLFTIINAIENGEEFKDYYKLSSGN